MKLHNLELGSDNCSAACFLKSASENSFEVVHLDYLILGYDVTFHKFYIIPHEPDTFSFLGVFGKLKQYKVQIASPHCTNCVGQEQ